jgi:hypothetical protein
MFFCSPTYSDCNIGQQKIKLPDNISCDELEIIRHKIRIAVNTTQLLISDIANSETDLIHKQKNIIPFTLAFFGSDAIVQITSLVNKTPKSFPIEDYLRNLANLAKTKKYMTIKLVFDENKIKFWIKPVNNNYVAMDVVTFQDFEGCLTSDHKKCYHDVTRKVFHVALTSKVGEPLTKGRIKINGITAEDTYSYEDFQKNSIIYTK